MAADLTRWRDEVTRSLKGKPFEKLVGATEDGIAVQPLYVEAHARPGAQTWGGPVRASRADGGWLVTQAHARPSPAGAARDAARDLAQGADAVLVVIDRAGRLGLAPDDPRGVALVGKHGVAFASADDAAAIAGAIGGGHPIFLDAGANAAPVAAMLASAFERLGVAASSVELMTSIDPLGALVSDGRLPRSVAEHLREAAWVKTAFPKGRALVASGLPYHEAGATAAVELGAIAATLLEYWRAGFAAHDVVLAVGCEADVFLGMAKVRALRIVTAKMAAATGVAFEQPLVLGVTSQRHATVRDVESNVLRGTSEAFALAVGGADAIVVRSFDAALGGPSAHALRVAKNTGIVLSAEAHIGHVEDPAAGSFAIESLTDALAEKAWDVMRAIEVEGGMARSIEAGAIQARVAAQHEVRQAALAKRKRTIVGVNEFAPIGHEVRSLWAEHDAERAAERARVKTGGPAVRAVGSFGDLVALAREGASLAVLSTSLAGGDMPRAVRLDRVRDADRFESLRAESDAMASSGARPSVAVLAAGAPAEHRARVDFARRFFELAGMNVTVVSEPAAVGAADVVVLASSDDRYAADGEAWLTALRGAARAAVVVLAGRAGPLAPALERVAPSREIFLGCDAVGVLAGVLQGIRARRGEVPR